MNKENIFRSAAPILLTTITTIEDTAASIRAAAAAGLDSVTIEEAEKKLVALYRKIINEDLEKLHIRCDRFVAGLRYVIATLVLSFISYALQILLRAM